VCRKRRTVFPRFGCPRDKRITIKYIYGQRRRIVDIIFFEIASRSFYTQTAFLSTDHVLSPPLSPLTPPREVVSLRTRVVCLYLWSFSSTVAFVMSCTNYVYIPSILYRTNHTAYTGRPETDRSRLVPATIQYIT